MAASHLPMADGCRRCSRRPATACSTTAERLRARTQFGTHRRLQCRRDLLAWQGGGGIVPVCVHRAHSRAPVQAAKAGVHARRKCYHFRVEVDLTRLTEEELVALNHRIAERLRLMRSARQLVQLAQFSVGMRVEFTADDGRVIQGEITRLNRKTATVCCDQAGHWRVSPSLLRPLDAVPSRPAHVHGFPRRS